MNEYGYQFREEDAYRFASEFGHEVHRDGSELKFKYCPFCKGGNHKDKETFSINLKTGAFNCKRAGCGHKGNMVTLMYEFRDFSLSKEMLVYRDRHERYRSFVKKHINSTDKAVEYLASRGISEDVARKYEITTRKDNDRILVFPFHNEKGSLKFVKYRNLNHEKGKGSKEWSEKDCEPILFGMNNCNFENDRVVLTEGQIDSLSCTEAGIENAVSVPMGMSNFYWFPFCCDFLARFNELVVFGDFENGHMTLLEEMKTRFHGKLLHVREEDYNGYKDANDILRNCGKEAVKKCVDNAVEVEIDQLKRITDVQRMSLRDLDRMRTGIRELDIQCPFIFGELIILTGNAGDGKSTLASQWVTMAIDQGYPSMIYSGEMPDWLVKNWVDFQIAGKHNLNPENDIEEQTYERIKRWDAYNELYVYDTDNSECSQQELFDVIDRAIRQYGIKFMVIDNLMTAMDLEDGLELNEAQTQFTKRLASIAQNKNVIIVLIVHPRKTNGSKPFSNFDIAGSSNITNRAHKVIRYSRPDKEFEDRDGIKWKGEELLECPIRMLTVLKDRLSGHTINKGIQLYFEPETKRITSGNSFNWKLGFELDKDGFEDAADYGIPF